MTARAIVLLLLLTPSLALAHPGHAGGLAAGVTHPLLGIDHLLAMLAAGWLAFSHRSPVAMGLAFCGLLLFGFLIGLATPAQAWVELGILGSLLIFGGLILVGKRLPLPALLAIAGVFAAAHGHAHGAEMATGLSAVAFGLGVAIASLLLLTAGYGLAAAVRGGQQAVSQRLAGSVLLVAAGYLLVAV